MYKKLLLGVILLGSCKSAKQATSKKMNRLPIREDGFYYAKNKDYTTDEYLLLKFYKNRQISESAPSVGIDELNTNTQMFACWLDYGREKDSTITYLSKNDSVFFKKKAWDSNEFATLLFACKVYGDSIVAHVKPTDYFDSTGIKINKPDKLFTTTYKFKQALCDTVFFRKMQKLEKQK